MSSTITATRPITLSLPEELLLLALKEESGAIHWKAGYYAYALSAGILSELLLADRIAPTGEKDQLEIITTATTGYPILDDALEKIASSGKAKTVQTWVQELAQLPQLTQRVAQTLCDRGIVSFEESRILYIFPKRRYRELDPRPEQQLIQRLRNAIFGNQHQLDERTAILIAIAYHTNLLAIPFERRELKAQKEWIESISNGHGIAASTKKAIEAVQAATMIAISAANSAAAVAVISS